MVIASSSPEILARREVNLGRVAGHDHLALVTEPGEEHLHLHAGAVLRLIEDDHGVGERAAAHEGERGDLDRAGGEPALDPFGREHVVKRVVKRPEIWIDLLAHVAGQEAEPLAGFDRGPRQDQPVALATSRAAAAKATAR